MDSGPKLDTLRFSFHQGLRPQDVKITNNTFDANLTRSKTTGDDKNVISRPVHIENWCFILKPPWISIGRTLLQTTAPFARVFLFPTSTDNYMNCKQQELRYELGCAPQNRDLSVAIYDTGKLSVAIYDTGKLFKYSATNHYTPHSGRCFMLSSTAALRY